MIVKGRYKYKYSTINLLAFVAKRFRSFSKKVGKTHSESLIEIMDFFEWHGFSPSERFEKSLGHEIIKNRKRSDAIIAIIKDIEKSQTKPTTAILQALLEGVAETEKEEETYDFGTPALITENEELTYYREEYHRCQKKLKAVNYELETVLNKTNYVKGGFGSSYLKLEMSTREFEELKQRINDVHNDNSPKNG